MIVSKNYHMPDQIMPKVVHYSGPIRGRSGMLAVVQHAPDRWQVAFADGPRGTWKVECDLTCWDWVNLHWSQSTTQPDWTIPTRLNLQVHRNGQPFFILPLKTYIIGCATCKKTGKEEDTDY